MYGGLPGAEQRFHALVSGRDSEILSRMFLSEKMSINSVVNVLWESVSIDYTLFVCFAFNQNKAF